MGELECRGNVVLLYWSGTEYAANEPELKSLLEYSIKLEARVHN